MTYAPDDLLAIQRYCRAQTGQPWESLGITHQQPNGGGYHEGHDLLHLAGRAPEDPGGDYSYDESPRDRNGLTDAASAFDLGGGFSRFREITLGIVRACELGDPRTLDVREVIYTPNGREVWRWDRLGWRASGDSSHLTHTHISFFRDSAGRRANEDNFLGLLVELFEGDDLKQDEREALFEVRDRTRWLDGREAAELDGTDVYLDPAGRPHSNRLKAQLDRIEAKQAAPVAIDYAELARALLNEAANRRAA